MTRAVAFVLLGLGLVAGPARAGDDLSEDGGYTLRASIENDAEGGAAFVVEGTAPNLPDGTLLHVTLAIKGKYTSPIEAAFFQTRVVDQEFRARKVFSQQRFAPLLYWARAELYVGNQRSAVKDWIRRELGVSARAKLLLAKQDIEVGDLEEQGRFAEYSLTELHGFILAYEALRQRVAAVTPEVIADDAWRATYTGLSADMGALSERFRDFQKPYVVWSDQAVLKKLGAAAGDLSYALSACDKGQHGRAQKVLGALGGKLQRLRAEVEARLPAPDEDPAEEPGGSPGPTDE